MGGRERAGSDTGVVLVYGLKIKLELGKKNPTGIGKSDSQATDTAQHCLPVEVLLCHPP